MSPAVAVAAGPTVAAAEPAVGMGGIAEMIRKATEEAQRGIEPPGGRG